MQISLNLCTCSPIWSDEIARRLRAAGGSSVAKPDRRVLSQEEEPVGCDTCCGTFQGRGCRCTLYPNHLIREVKGAGTRGSSSSVSTRQQRSHSPGPGFAAENKAS
ncbi:hypothetical protein AAFF_G00101180 [Aldrovandia affinis]|uniref:Uncharacterized protein n=1 Tax=Aldrovandia affinis TaxID=143900 RepID=A0AAD7RV48_9TELE|nr:hypothetical protein AAFF_G00101180 [Aldrovandia affinis]